MVTRPLPLYDLERMSRTPPARARIDSRRDVTSASIARAEFPGIEKLTVIDGSVSEGISFTGSSGTSAHPAIATAIKATIMLNPRLFNSKF